MFKKRITIIFNSNIIIYYFFICTETKLESGKPYILAKIDVTGKISYNEQTITTFTGLEKGQKLLFLVKIL